MLTFDDGWTEELEQVALPSLPRPLRVATEQPAAADDSAWTLNGPLQTTTAGG
ncbi:MAG: hypothetical protein JO023_12130 [Chloroflexi bacterium]|nr:hypothetical protein [Chloroflexota bacterium]